MRCRSCRSLNVWWVAAGLWLALAGGCADVRLTDPERTATQQFLMTEAIAIAVEQLGTEMLRDRRVYVDDLLLDVPQESYLTAAIRARLLEEGVRLVPTRDDAQIVVELRSQGVGIDRSQNFIGVPPILVPAQPEVGDVQTGTLITPEIALYKKVHQKGFAAVAFSAYWRDTGELVGGAGPTYGYTERKDVWIFGIGPSTTGNIVPTRPPITEVE